VSEQSLETRIALLEREHAHLLERMDEHHADTQRTLTSMTEQLSTLNASILTQHGASKARGAMWTAVRHGATVIVSSAFTLWAAKKLHVPIELGDAATQVGKHLS